MLLGIGGVLTSSAAEPVPSLARQTGLGCAQRHNNHPEVQARSAVAFYEQKAGELFAE